MHEIVEAAGTADTLQHVVGDAGHVVDEVFAHRKSLYEEYADVTADCFGKTTEQIVAEIMDCHKKIGAKEV